MTKPGQMQGKTRGALPGILVAISLAGGSLAGCSQPAPVAMAPPPPPAPVGHAYQVMVQVPSPTRHIRITPEQQQDAQQAFNVIALKSALMVGALSCNQQTQYDRFMTEFQPHILAEQHVMDAYFRRGNGYYFQAKEDDFVTLLANNQSVGGIAQGAVFCLNNNAEFQAVLALKTPTDLDNFVTDLPPGSPMVIAASPSVTPLAPNDTSVTVAVVHTSPQVPLVKTHNSWWHFGHKSAPVTQNVAALAPTQTQSIDPTVSQ